MKPNQPSTTADPTADRLPVVKTYKLYLGGKFPRTESGHSYPVTAPDGTLLANACRGTRKDFRNAVVAARAAQPGWAKASAYLRGQVLYRVAEMLEGRAAQFVDELVSQGDAPAAAQAEVAAAVDRLVYYAGWTDKVQQVYSSVNPVASSHFNFTLLEPTGVVSVLAPETPALLGLIAVVAPILAGGNACVVHCSESRPLCAMSFAEVLHTSDVPGGVVNLITGPRDELTDHFASHMDVNAIVCSGDAALATSVREAAVDNLKRVTHHAAGDVAGSPERILDTMEAKTTWHPIGQ